MVRTVRSLAILTLSTALMTLLSSHVGRACPIEAQAVDAGQDPRGICTVQFAARRVVVRGDATWIRSYELGEAGDLTPLDAIPTPIPIWDLDASRSQNGLSRIYAPSNFENGFYSVDLDDAGDLGDFEFWNTIGNGPSNVALNEEGNRLAVSCDLSRSIEIWNTEGPIPTFSREAPLPQNAVIADMKWIDSYILAVASESNLTMAYELTESAPAPEDDDDPTSAGRNGGESLVLTDIAQDFDYPASLATWKSSHADSSFVCVGCWDNGTGALATYMVNGGNLVLRNFFAGPDLGWPWDSPQVTYSAETDRIVCATVTNGNRIQTYTPQLAFECETTLSEQAITGFECIMVPPFDQSTAGGDILVLNEIFNGRTTTVRIEDDGPSAVDPTGPDLPGALQLAGPNPFAIATSFRLSLERAERVEVEVFDVFGRRVRSLFSGRLDAGDPQEVRFDGRGLPNGTYFVKLQGASATDSKTVTLLRE